MARREFVKAGRGGWARSKSGHGVTSRDGGVGLVRLGEAPVGPGMAGRLGRVGGLNSEPICIVVMAGYETIWCESRRGKSRGIGQVWLDSWGPDAKWACRYGLDTARSEWSSWG